jgi:hypothetical protein
MEKRDETYALGTSAIHGSMSVSDGVHVDKNNSSITVKPTMESYALKTIKRFYAVKDTAHSCDCDGSCTNTIVGLYSDVAEGCGNIVLGYHNLVKKGSNNLIIGVNQVVTGNNNVVLMSTSEIKEHVGDNMIIFDKSLDVYEILKSLKNSKLLD